MKNAFLSEYETRKALAEFILQGGRLSMDTECRRFESKFAEGKAGEIERKILAAEGMDFRNFRVGGMSELSSKGSRKSIVLKPENFKLIEAGADEFNEGKRFAKVSFFLSKGNYATTVLKELLKEEIF